jgi:hypothetical protein
MDSTSLPRLRRIADEIKAMASVPPGEIAPGLPPADFGATVGDYIIEASKLGVFDRNSDYARLRALLRNQLVNYGGDEPGAPCQKLGSFMEAINCLAPDCLDEKDWPRACVKIGDILQAEIASSFPTQSEHTTGEIQADAKDEIGILTNSAPPLDRTSGAWVSNKRAAEIDGVETRTLADYRVRGIKDAGGNLGRDKDGRVWRREGTSRSHPWYLRSTLRAK